MKNRLKCVYSQDGEFAYVEGLVDKTSIHKVGVSLYTRLHLVGKNGERDSFPVSMGYISHEALLGKTVKLQHRAHDVTWTIIT